jgi:hypothetical protein
MFKAIAIGLALIAGTNTLQLQHEESNFDFKVDFDLQNLTTDQKAADSYFRSVIPNLSGAVLAGGQQNGNYYNYQYMRQTTPLTLTQISANRIDSNANTFQLVETTQTVNGPVQGGSLTSVSKSYAIDGLAKALENLDWD